MADKPVTRKDIDELSKGLQELSKSVFRVISDVDDVTKRLEAHEKTNDKLDDRIASLGRVVVVNGQEEMRHVEWISRRFADLEKRLESVDKRLGVDDKRLDELTKTLVEVAVKARAH
jgi:uncharacterized coiled-coil protein SlyX